MLSTVASIYVHRQECLCHKTDLPEQIESLRLFSAPCFHPPNRLESQCMKAFSRKAGSFKPSESGWAFAFMGDSEHG